MKTVTLAIIVVLVLGISSCGRAPGQLASYVGQNCEVQFRRDALGGAAALPVPPTTDNINGAQVSLSGRLDAATSNSILIVAAQKRYWIPLDSVLLVEFSVPE